MVSKLDNVKANLVAEVLNKLGQNGAGGSDPSGAEDGLVRLVGQANGRPGVPAHAETIRKDLVLGIRGDDKVIVVLGVCVSGVIRLHRIIQ